MRTLGIQSSPCFRKLVGMLLEHSLEYVSEVLVGHWRNFGFPSHGGDKCRCPITGSNRAQNTATSLGDVLFFLGFRNTRLDFFLFCGGGGNFSPMANFDFGHIAILFGPFLELPKM